MRMRNFEAVSLFLLGLALSGCSQNTPKKELEKQDPGIKKETISQGSPSPHASDKVELKSASLQEVDKAIAASKGKIVILDIWGYLCPPCKKEFPNLVRMSQQYSPDDLGCISLCLPMISTDEKKQTVIFLQEQKAVLTNFWLEGEDAFEMAQKRWNFKGVPAVIVYGRDGTIVQAFTNDNPDNQFTYEDVEKLVHKLTQKK